MRIAFFHNWSWLGSALGRSLLDHLEPHDALWLIGGHAAPAERDPDLVERAERRGAANTVPDDVRSDVFLGELTAFEPDLIVVGTFAKKLPGAVLRIPRLAAINVHSSLLPRYRGAIPEFWVLRNGEAQSGLTIHLMTEEFDAGRILDRAVISLADTDTLLTLSVRMCDAGPMLLQRVLARYRRGELPAGELQDERLVSFAPLVQSKQLEIDWREPSASIERLTRAAFPVFEVFTRFSGQRVVVRGVRVATCSERLDPGALHLDEPKRCLFAGTGDGALVLEQIEIGGEAGSGYRLTRFYDLDGGKLG